MKTDPFAAKAIICLVFIGTAYLIYRIKKLFYKKSDYTKNRSITITKAARQQRELTNDRR